MAWTIPLDRYRLYCDAKLPLVKLGNVLKLEGIALYFWEYLGDRICTTQKLETGNSEPPQSEGNTVCPAAPLRI